MDEPQARYNEGISKKWRYTIVKTEQITQGQMDAFARELQRQERSAGTVGKYLRDVCGLRRWLAGRPVTQETVLAWKNSLLQRGYCPATINSMLTAVNRFFAFLGWDGIRVKTLRLQRRLFRTRERELSRAEYDRLLQTAADQGRERLALLMETLCATGIRVSEVRYITVEAVRAGRAEVALKGKIRTILLPGKLRRKLLRYARRQKTVSGQIFVTRSGRGMSRKQIWAEMKAVCREAGVAESKVFPHNLRHLFARTFYRVSRDVAKLADLLGHSSLETTRIYLVSTGEEHMRALNRLRLVQ